MLAELNLRLTIEQATDDHYHVHGYELTIYELVRQMHRIRALYAAELTDGAGDGIGSDFVWSDRRIGSDRRGPGNLDDR